MKKLVFICCWSLAAYGQSWNVSVAIFNGPLKAVKAFSKYSGRNELAAIAGGFNAFGDFSLLCLREKPSISKIAIFLTRLTRELLRASNGPLLKTTGSYADLFAPDNNENFANAAKGLLKIPILIEKNLNWDFVSSMPGILLSLLEHYARYYRRYVLRPIAGFALTALELNSFYSESTDKSARQLIRITFHALQYYSLLRDRTYQGALKFKIFTYLTMFEHLLVSGMDLLLYDG